MWFGVSVGNFAIANRYLPFREDFIDVKLKATTPKMWKKYLVVVIFIVICLISSAIGSKLGGKRKKSGKSSYDPFQLLSFITSFEG